MQTIIFGILIFLEILQWIVIIDIILSWVAIFGLNIRPKFISDIIDPMYKFVKNKIPSSIGPFDFTPMIIIFAMIFIRGLIIVFFPEVSNTYLTISQNI